MRAVVGRARRDRDDSHFVQTAPERELLAISGPHEFVALVVDAEWLVGNVLEDDLEASLSPAGSASSRR